MVSDRLLKTFQSHSSRRNAGSRQLHEAWIPGPAPVPDSGFARTMLTGILGLFPQPAQWQVILVLTLAAVLTGIAHPTGARAGPLTEQEKRGRHIYIKTTSPSGNEIKAIVGKGALEAPGPAVTCVSCHDFEGQGINQHGIAATNITWEDLTKPYRFKRDKGRDHPPYTEATLKRAIVEGIDPAGNKLDETMPRYRMSAEDLNDLVAYLKVIGKALDPGLTETSIKVGTVLPSAGTFAEMGRAIQAVIEACFKEVNAGGGIYNRKFELSVADGGGTADTTTAALERLMSEEEVFAVVSPFTLGADKEAAALAESLEVPMIGPFTIFPEDIHALNRYTFYLLSGLREQARAQVAYAREVLGSPDPRIAVVYHEEETSGDILEAIEAQGAAHKWKSMERAPYTREAFEPSKLAETLHRKGVEAVFHLGGWERLQALLTEADRLQWIPYVFISGVQVKGGILDIPTGFTRRVFIAYPMLPSDHTARGIRELDRLLRNYGLSTSHMAAQISAYCAAKVLVEGIKKAGGKLSREKLVNSLDTMFKFETHLMPPISYDPNRRIGVLGSHMVTIDLEKKAFVPLGKWISLE